MSSVLAFLAAFANLLVIWTTYLLFKQNGGTIDRAMRALRQQASTQRTALREQSDRFKEANEMLASLVNAMIQRMGDG